MEMARGSGENREVGEAQPRMDIQRACSAGVLSGEAAVSSRSHRGFSGEARPPGGQLMWLKQAPGQRQAPSRRLALPGAPCTSWYLCLRLYILHSQALPRGSPRPQVLQGLGKAGSPRRQPSWCCLPTPTPRCSLPGERGETPEAGEG